MLPHVYNFSIFYCKRNEISSEDGDFLIEASAISGFACEGVSKFRKSECTSDQFFFFCFDGDSCDGLGSEFCDELAFMDVLLSEGFVVRPPLVLQNPPVLRTPPFTKGSNDVQLSFVDEEVSSFQFFPSGLGVGES
ncbi:MAG: hypothetical protein LBI53_06925 [Candidatus Peribacteria bacterium]|jgi:hypothetical protein|nr:hypothetical protein [Candidatus Peribacteria bacterium]